MKFDRIPLSSCKKIKNENDIPGNFTSVRGEYIVPGENRTGFYKLNCSIENNEDLRELLASILLKSINIPAADILPIYDDEKQQNGCISMSILKEGEMFLEDDVLKFFDIPEDLKKMEGIDKFIAIDLFRYSEQYNFSPEFLQERKKFLIDYVFISAFLGNDDIKTANCQVIYDSKSNTIRNPEYYDMGKSFFDSTYVGSFFTGQLATEVLQELYEKYPNEVEKISKRIEKLLNKEYIKNILMAPVFKDFNQENLKNIWSNLGHKITYISRQNELLYGISHDENSFITSLKQIKDTTKETDISLIDKAKIFLQALKTKMLGEISR